MLAEISKMDPSTKKRIIDIKGAMINPEFQRDVDDAVHGVLKQNGKLIVNNKTGAYQRIFVNRTEHLLRPGINEPIPVDVGTVAVQIPGRDLTTWTIAPPNYSQSIDIVPATRRTYTFNSPSYDTIWPIYGSSVRTIIYPLSDFPAYSGFPW
jgi:hypothetical protein